VRAELDLVTYDRLFPKRCGLRPPSPVSPCQAPGRKAILDNVVEFSGHPKRQLYHKRRGGPLLYWVLEIPSQGISTNIGPDLLFRALEGIRTPNLLIRSQFTNVADRRRLSLLVAFGWPE